MRVIHIITRLIIGGAQENTVATVLGLRKRPDVQVDLISGPTTGREGSMELAFAACPEVLTVLPALVRPVHPWNDVLALFQLTNLLRARRPDLVHTHSGKAGVLGRLAARRAGVRVILHHIHGPSFGSFQGPVANFVFTAAERRAARATTHFLCSANAMTRLYLAKGIGRPEMFTRVFSGFHIASFLNAQNDVTLRAQLGLAADAFVIGKIGRLAPLKGHDDLFRAFKLLLAQLLSARLLIIGDGPLRPKLEALSHELGLRDKVVFTGLLPPAEVPRYVGIMDCLAHLSSREAVSRALPQALAAGKPVVSYDFDGADEVCLNGKTGFLVRTGEIQTAANRLLELAKNPALREQLGRAGQEFVKQEFPVEAMVEKIYQVYTRLLEGNSRSVLR
jgi:glycosyltransferase involved in cell wall biosynthesis